MHASLFNSTFRSLDDLYFFFFLLFFFFFFYLETTDNSLYRNLVPLSIYLLANSDHVINVTIIVLILIPSITLLMDVPPTGKTKIIALLHDLIRVSNLLLFLLRRALIVHLMHTPAPLIGCCNSSKLRCLPNVSSALSFSCF